MENYSKIDDNIILYEINNNEDEETDNNDTLNTEEYIEDGNSLN